MPTWHDTPPEPSDFAGIRLLRAPTGGWLGGTITSDKLKGTYTHYSHRRTQAHANENCELCLCGDVPRWHGYLSFLNPVTHSHAVLELTAISAQVVADYQQRHGSIRGALITAKRRGNRPNGTVEIEIKPQDKDLRTLPAPVDLGAFLDHLWCAEKNPSAIPNRSRQTPNRIMPPPADPARDAEPITFAKSNGQTKKREPEKN